jgi:hypothetical protein
MGAFAVTTTSSLTATISLQASRDRKDAPGNLLDELFGTDHRLPYDLFPRWSLQDKNPVNKLHTRDSEEVNEANKTVCQISLPNSQMCNSPSLNLY